MFNYPYGDSQQINLNWIISEIIALHQQLDPNYTAPTFTQIYPFSDTQQLNLDWILTELKALKELAPTPPPTEEINEIGRALIAGAYDADTQYQQNDYIVQDGKLYRANAATTGTFDPTKWREVLLGDDLAIIIRWADVTNTYLNSLAASNVANDSDVLGATVKDALNTLKNNVSGMSTDDVANESNVTGESTTTALNNLNDALNANESAIAIVANGNTHAAIASGQYVYIKGHATLTDGLYKATAAIPLNGTLSTTNVSSASDGGLNDLDSTIKDRDKNILYPLKDHGTWNAYLMGVGIQIDSDRIYCVFNLPFFMKDYNYSVVINDYMIRPGFTIVPQANLAVDSKYNNAVNIIAQSAGAAGVSYPCRVSVTISYD